MYSDTGTVALAHKRVARKRIPMFNMLPTPDPSGAGKPFIILSAPDV